jgi:hypothetical protein
MGEVAARMMLEEVVAQMPALRRLGERRLYFEVITL